MASQAGWTTLNDRKYVRPIVSDCFVLITTCLAKKNPEAFAPGFSILYKCLIKPI